MYRRPIQTAQRARRLNGFLRKDIEAISETLLARCHTFQIIRRSPRFGQGFRGGLEQVFRSWPMNRSPQLLICVEDVNGGGVICRAPVVSTARAHRLRTRGNLTAGTREGVEEPSNTLGWLDKRASPIRSSASPQWQCDFARVLSASTQEACRETSGPCLCLAPKRSRGTWRYSKSWKAD